MEHFVSIILADYELEEHLIESILDSAKVGLLESETLYEMFETDDDEQVLRVELPRQLSIQESDEFAETLAHKLFEMGYEDFDIEVSAEEQELPFDIAEDLYVFIKNDPMFYRRAYFPALSKIAGQIKNKKKVNFKSALGPMVDKGFEAYRKKYKLPRSTKLSLDNKETIVNRIRDDEMPEIRKGEY